MYPRGSKGPFGLLITHPSATSDLVFGCRDSGNQVNVFSGSNGQFTLMGRPILFTSHLPTLGDADDLMFCDLSQYAIGIRRGLQLERSNIPGWTKDLMSYRALLRFDGMGTWNTFITPRNGDTLSWVVSMAKERNNQPWRSFGPP